MGAGAWKIPTGTILAYVGRTIPYGWLRCEGASLARARYPGLFAVLGTMYGSRSPATFSLPTPRVEYLALGETAPIERWPVPTDLVYIIKT